jgi:surface protein
MLLICLVCFFYCHNLISIPKLNTSNVTDMSWMFYCCENLESIPELDTSKVKDMFDMFSRCYNLESIPNLDTSKVQNISGMFWNCKNLKEIDMSNFHLYDFTELDNKFLKEKYSEYFI